MPQRYCGTPKNANFYKKIRWNLSTYKIIDENRGKQEKGLRPKEKQS